MTERSIVEAAARLRRHGEPHLLATVVCVHGAPVRRPGARMLLTRFRWVAGAVSGGCLEGDLANQAWWRTRDGAPVLLTYDARVSDETDDDDVRAAFGLGCDGVIEVLVERTGITGRIDALEVASRCLRRQRRGAIATVFRSSDPAVRVASRLALLSGGELEREADPIEPEVEAAIVADICGAIESGLSANRTYATAHGTIEILIEAVLPPPRLFLFGTGHDAVPVAELARSTGWDVVICSREPRFSTRERFALADEIVVGEPHEIAPRIAAADRAVAIVMGHHLDRDRAALEMLLESRAVYIGVLGPRSRTQLLVAGALDDPRVHAPFGLELGAETPQELALAVIAEVQRELSRPTPARVTADPRPITVELPLLAAAL